MHMFLSPHYDDAAYSCGATIHKFRHEGVIIFTLMAGNPPPNLVQTPIVQQVHQACGVGDNPVPTRRQEDQQAGTHLGAQTLYNEIPDCIYRASGQQPLYPTQAALFGKVHPADDAAQELQSLGVVFGGVDALYAPLAVGNHVDHQIVRDWALHLKRTYPHMALYFYTDFPYARDPQAINRALAFFQPQTLDAHRIAYDDDDLSAKIRAMQAYRTQTRLFWQDDAALEAEIHQQPRYETYWRLRETQH